MHASSVMTLTGATLVTGFVGYAIYFDYKRRNDPAFRSQLKKDRKRTSKEIKKQGEKKKKEVGDVIERTVNELNKPGVLPAGVNEREEVFMQSVQEGEQLLLQGQEFYIVAAAAFFKALKVYPSPLELLRIYQKAVPEQALSYIYEMVAKDSALSAGAANPLAGNEGSLEEIDDTSPEKSSSSAAPGVSTPSVTVSSQEGEGESVAASSQQGLSAPASSQEEGVESGNNSPKNGDTSSVEWEKVSPHEDEEKRSAAVALNESLLTQEIQGTKEAAAAAAAISSSSDPADDPAEINDAEPSTVS